MLKHCKAATEQNIALSSIGFVEVHVFFFLAITLQNSNTNRLLNSSRSQNKINFSYSHPYTLKIEIFRLYQNGSVTYHVTVG